jgi:AcrR family transcriptional regulator
MITPARILRAQADALRGGPPALSPREQALQERVLGAAAKMMAALGYRSVTMRGLADALEISPTTVKRMFCDIESVLAEILSGHLRDIAAKFGEIAKDADNLQAARRAVYLACTRTGFGGPTARHLLLLRDRHALPPDLAEPLEALRLSVGDMMGYPNGPAALALLDCQGLSGPQIETMLAALAPEPAPQSPPSPARSASQAREEARNRARLALASSAFSKLDGPAAGTADTPVKKMVRDHLARRRRLLN